MVAESNCKVDVCVTLFNEEENVVNLIKEFNEYNLENQFLGRLILVDNGSYDKTWENICLQQNSQIVTFRLPKNIGYGGGAAQAIYHSVHDHIALIPANNQYSFKEISNLVREYCKMLENKNKLILLKGRRTNRRDPYIVRVLSFLYSILIGILSGRNIRDANGAPKIFHKKIILAKLAGLPKDACFDAALIIELSKSGVKVIEKPVTYHKRRHGRASWEGKKLIISLKMLTSILSYRLNR